MERTWKKRLIAIGVEIVKVVIKYIVPALAGYFEGSEQVISNLFSF